MPDSLKQLLWDIIKAKSETTEDDGRRRTATQHRIIFAYQPRFFISPILIDIGV